MKSLWFVGASCFVIGILIGHEIRPAGTLQAVARPVAETPAARSVKAAVENANAAKRADAGANAAAGGDEDGVPSLAEIMAKVDAKKFLRKAVGDLSKVPVGERAAMASALAGQLRLMGKQGLAAMREFFNKGEDILLTDGNLISYSNLGQTSLRAKLLASLEDWSDPEATRLSLDVLHDTPSMREAMQSIRNLEKASPGAYREDAIRSLTEILQNLPDKPDSGNSMEWNFSSNMAMEAFAFFQAPELIPAIENIVKSEGGYQEGRYLLTLDQMPEEAGLPAIQRLFSDPKAATSLANNPQMLTYLDLTKGDTASRLAGLFQSQMDESNREHFLQSLGSEGRTGFGGVLTNLNKNGAILFPKEVPSLSQLQAKLQLLQQVAPCCTTPVLQQRWQQAQKQLNDRINSMKNRAAQ